MNYKTHPFFILGVQVTSSSYGAVWQTRDAQTGNYERFATRKEAIEARNKHAKNAGEFGMRFVVMPDDLSTSDIFD